jgi:hypothetical protein
LTIEGIHLKKRIVLAVQFYKSLSSDEKVSNIVKLPSGYMPEVDAFMDSFIHHYTNNKEYRGSLMVKLMKGYTAKVDGVKNPAYGSKVINFMLALTAGGNKKAFEFVSGNLCSASLRHMKWLTAWKVEAPLINLTDKEIISHIMDTIVKI